MPQHVDRVRVRLGTAPRAGRGAELPPPSHAKVTSAEIDRDELPVRMKSTSKTRSGMRSFPSSRRPRARARQGLAQTRATAAAIIEWEIDQRAGAGEVDAVENRSSLAPLPQQPGTRQDGCWPAAPRAGCPAGEPASALRLKQNTLSAYATTGANKFPVLESGEIDILSRSVTQTASRENELGFDFIGPNHLTGTHFMVHKDTGVTRAEQLDGATVCVLSGTTTEEYLADWFRAEGMGFEPVAAEDSDQMFSMYLDNRCDAVTMEPAYLAIRRSRSENPEGHVILDRNIAKSFEAPVILEGNPEFRELLQWMHWGMVAMTRPRIVESTMPSTATLLVLSSPTRKARA